MDSTPRAVVTSKAAQNSLDDITMKHAEIMQNLGQRSQENRLRSDQKAQADSQQLETGRAYDQEFRLAKIKQSP